MRRFTIFLSLFLFNVAQGVPILENSLYYSYNPRRTVAPDGWYDIQHYDIHWKFERPDTSYLHNAWVRITILKASDCPDTVMLDFEGLTCDSVFFSHWILDIYTHCDFFHSGDTLFIILPIHILAGDSFFLTFHYHGQPQSIFSAVNRYGRRYIYSLFWPSNARSSFPSIDHPKDKATSSLTVTVPAEWKVASNGLLASVFTSYSLSTWRWENRFPICTYNICFSAGLYSMWEDTSASGTPILYFVYPEDSSRARYDWERTPQILDTFVQYFGEYPFDKYGMVQIPMGALGGMEHQTMTSMAEGLITGTRAYESVVAHEISHSWFGNSAGLEDWRDFWLNEGFATFSEIIFTRAFSGEDASVNYRRIVQQQFKSSGESFPMYDPEIYLSYTCYNKGACVVWMLLDMLGEETFFQAIRQYLSNHKFGTVITETLKSYIESAYGEPVDWFFEQWVYQSGFPTIYYGFDYWPGGAITIHMEQMNLNGSCPFFRLKVPVWVQTSSGWQRHDFWLEDTIGDFEFAISHTPSDLRVNKNYDIIANTVREWDVSETKYSDFNIAITPNPFNSSCVICVPAGTDVKIYDLCGKCVWKNNLSPRRIANKVKQENIIWTPDESIPSGIYLIRMTIGEQSVTKRVALIR